MPNSVVWLQCVTPQFIFFYHSLSCWFQATQIPLRMYAHAPQAVKIIWPVIWLWLRCRSATYLWLQNMWLCRAPLKRQREGENKISSQNCAYKCVFLFMSHHLSHLNRCKWDFACSCTLHGERLVPLLCNLACIQESPLPSFFDKIV